MTAPQALIFPLTLSRAELAFLLSVLESPPLVGDDPEELFPTDEQQRLALLLEGKAELEGRGWLHDSGEGQTDEAFAAVVEIVRNLAFAAAMVVCNFQRPGDGLRGVRYAIGDAVVVELARIDAVYYLTPRESPAVAAEQLSQLLGIPPEPYATGAFVVPREAFLAAREGQARLPLPMPEAELLATTLQAPTTSAMLTVFGRRWRGPDEMRLLGVFVGAQGDAWLITPVGEEQVEGVAVGAASFESTLLAALSELMAAVT